MFVNAISVKTNGLIEKITLPKEDTLSELQAYVDGYVQVVALNDDVDMWFNEEGKIQKLAHNLKAQSIWDYYVNYPDFICGNVVITGVDENGSIVNINDADYSFILERWV